MKNKKIEVKELEITVSTLQKSDYISLTDIAKHKNPETTGLVISHWMSTKDTVEFIGLWEKLHNPDFKQVEFDLFRSEAGYSHFVLSAQKWIDATNAIGLQSKAGRYGGTYAHIDIALEFASWVSADENIN